MLWFIATGHKKKHISIISISISSLTSDSFYDYASQFCFPLQFTRSATRRMTSDNDRDSQMSDHECDVIIFQFNCNLTVACKHRRDEKGACFKNTEVASMCNLALTLYCMWVIIVTTKHLTGDFQSVLRFLGRHADTQWCLIERCSLWHGWQHMNCVAGLLQHGTTNKMWLMWINFEHRRAHFTALPCSFTAWWTLWQLQGIKSWAQTLWRRKSVIWYLVDWAVPVRGCTVEPWNI